MSKIDYILLAPIIFGIVYGLYRGFFKEIVVISCVIVALFVSRYFGELIANLLSKVLDWNINITKPISIVLNITSLFYQNTHKEDRNRLAQSKLYEPIRKSLDVVVPLLDFDSFTDKPKKDK